MPDDAPPVASEDLQGALSTISGTGNQALAQYQSDQANLEGVGKDLANIPAFDAQKEMAQEPQVNRNSFMGMAPLLIGLTALGGKVAGVHPGVMLGATNGMMKGLISGNDKAYSESKQRYDDAYQRYIDKYKQQVQIYKEMQQVYKGQVNSDLKALEISLRATGYEGKIDEQTLRAWQWNQSFAAKMEAQQERQRHDRATEGAAQQRIDKPTKATTAAGGKATDRKAMVNQANSLIDDLLKTVDKKASIGGIPAPVTGIGGKAARVSETVGNITGISDESPASDYETKTHELQLLAGQLLTKGPMAKWKQEKLDKIVRGLAAGDTPQKTAHALKELKKALNGPEFEVGKVYVDAQGRKAMYQEDGTWKPQ